MRLLYLDESQASTLERWKHKAENESNWNEQRKRCFDGHLGVHRIVEDSGFLEGNDLSKEQVRMLFSYLQLGMGNRAFNRNIYEKNSLRSFNLKLRLLFKYAQSFPKSFDELLKLNGIGIWSASQLLCKWEPEEYPFVATSNGKGFMDKVLLNHMDGQQLRLAGSHAMQTYNNSNASLSTRTRFYLTCCMIFDEIREVMQFESFLDVQSALWFAFSEELVLERSNTPLRQVPSQEAIAESSSWAMDKAIEYERSQNRNPKDVSNLAVGYDILSTNSITGETRYIEVKGRRLSLLVTLTDNECASARRLGKKYFIYIIRDDGKVWILRDPIRECTFKEIKRTNWQIIDWEEKGTLADIALLK